MGKMMKSMALATLTTLLVACSGNSSSPETTAKTFVKESFNGNADAIIAMIYIPDEEKSKAGVQDMVNGKIKAGVSHSKEIAEKEGGVDEITTEPAQISEKDGKKLATVKVKTKFKKGAERSNDVRLIDTDKGWKIRI